MPNYRIASASSGGASTLANISNSAYVSNIRKYTGTTVSISDPITERAEAWANFYYKILAQSGMKLNIQTTPTNPDSLNVYVDSKNRTLTQGPYKTDIVDSNGKVITNQATEHYTGITLGTLVYNEINKLNMGCNIFQFCSLKSTTANVVFTNGDKHHSV